MKEGMIWRVGDGESIDIWNDPWLPRGITRRVSSAQGHILLTRVSELINLITNRLDQELIRGIFHEDDAAVILGIPLAANMGDSIAWHFDKKGLFSVKSAYKVSVAASRDNHGPSSGEATQCTAMGTVFPWKMLGASLRFRAKATSSIPPPLGIPERVLQVVGMFWRLPNEGPDGRRRREILGPREQTLRARSIAATANRRLPRRRRHTSASHWDFIK
jgi:hypothetical protein